MSGRRALAAVLCAHTAFAVVFLGAIAGLWGSPLYYPLERRWSFVKADTGIAMAWFGGLAEGIVAAVVALAFASVATSRGPLARVVERPRTITKLVYAVALATLLNAGFFSIRFVQAATKPVTVHYLPCPVQGGR